MSGQATLNVVQVFVILVAVSAGVALVARRVAVPYTVVLVVFGLGGSFVAPTIGFGITQELVLAVLLPGLIFEAAYRLDVRELRATFGGIALLAVPGVILTTLIVAAVLALATGLPFQLGMIVGAMVSATDPAAVVAIFTRLRAPRRLITLVEGESLFNDGTALVVFSMSLAWANDGITLESAAVMFVFTLLASAVIGGTIGYVASRIISTVDDHLIELTISVATAYGAYLVADLFSQSGIIATVVAGMILGTYGRSRWMSARTQEALDTVWEFAAFLLTALVFLLIGFVISLPDLVAALGSIAWAVVAILVGRAAAIYGILGGTSRLVRRRLQPAVPLGWLHVTFWAGLRGAVAVAMALSLPLQLPQRELLQEITFGVVLFTLLVQGTTAEMVVRWAVRTDAPARAARDEPNVAS